MELDIVLWNQALDLEKKLKEKGEPISWTKISNNLFLPERQSRYIWFALKNKDVISPHVTSEKPDKKSVERDFEEEQGTITTKSLNIRTVEDAARESNLDLEEWEIYRHTVNSWEVTMGGDKTKSGIPETFTNYQVKLWVRKRIPDVNEIALNSVIDRLNSQEVEKSVDDNFTTDKNEDVMVIFGLVDNHFGLMAYDEETGEGDYDLETAERLYMDAVEDGIERVSNMNISKIVIPIGNDFFHINDISNKTPKGGNNLDVTGKLSRIFETGEMAVIKAVQKCQKIAPVDLLWVPGNHDPQTSYFLCKVLNAYYENNDRVNVDISPKYRKFMKWGTNLIGFTHGTEEPIKNLPHIMVDSCSQWVAECKNREWLTGHIHKKKETNFVGIDSMGSTIVRVLPSLCSIDQWHYKKGYVGNAKSMEMYAYNKDGFVGYFSIYKRK